MYVSYVFFAKDWLIYWFFDTLRNNAWCAEILSRPEVSKDSAGPPHDVGPLFSEANAVSTLRHFRACLANGILGLVWGAERHVQCRLTWALKRFLRTSWLFCGLLWVENVLVRTGGSGKTGKFEKNRGNRVNEGNQKNRTKEDSEQTEKRVNRDNREKGQWNGTIRMWTWKGNNRHKRRQQR